LPRRGRASEKNATVVSCRLGKGDVPKVAADEGSVK
jgi:hypothetical protein